MVGSYHLEVLNDGSSTYEIANAAFTSALNDVFGSNTFSYNTKFVELIAVNESSPNTAEPYQYYFNLPEDLNLLIKICHPTEHHNITHYKLYNGLLHTDEKTIDIYYTYIPSETTINLLPAYLHRLISLHMAVNMAIELSGSENRVVQLTQQYTAALSRARVVSARQGPAQEYINESTSRFLRAHNQYGKV